MVKDCCLTTPVLPSYLQVKSRLQRLHKVGKEVAKIGACVATINKHGNAKKVEFNMKNQVKSITKKSKNV